MPGRALSVKWMQIYPQRFTPHAGNRGTVRRWSHFFKGLGSIGQQAAGSHPFKARGAYKVLLTISMSGRDLSLSDRAKAAGLHIRPREADVTGNDVRFEEIL